MPLIDEFNLNSILPRISFWKASDWLMPGLRRLRTVCRVGRTLLLCHACPVRLSDWSAGFNLFKGIRADGLRGNIDDCLQAQGRHRHRNTPQKLQRPCCEAHERCNFVGVLKEDKRGREWVPNACSSLVASNLGGYMARLGDNSANPSEEICNIELDIRTCITPKKKTFPVAHHAVACRSARDMLFFFK